jgi:formamidopyrimidine-DNA glycosylase
MCLSFRPIRARGKGPFDSHVCALTQGEPVELNDRPRLHGPARNCTRRIIRLVPELPEVERARRTLRRVMEGSRFERVVARRPDLRYPLPVDFSARLEGRTVRKLQRRAKYLLAELSSGSTLVMHLGMSASFSVVRRAVPFAPHDHVVFEMSSGATVIFNDPRRFGSMRIVDGPVAADPMLSTLGPEPLARGFGAPILAAALANRRTTLKAALSDQRVVAGLGNIYVSESLHRAGLSPMRRASTLVTRSGDARPQLVRLAAAIRAVLADALASRTGDEDRFRVYERDGRRCLRRGCPGVIKRIVQAGRSTFFCPVCQR